MNYYLLEIEPYLSQLCGTLKNYIDSLYLPRAVLLLDSSCTPTTVTPACSEVCKSSIAFRTEL